MRLYEDRYEKKVFYEALRRWATPSCDRYLMISLIQGGENDRRVFEKDEEKASDIYVSSSTSGKRAELVRRIYEISDYHGGILWRVILFSSRIQGINARKRTEDTIAKDELLRMQYYD